MFSGGFAVVTVVYLLVVLAALVLGVALIVLAFAGIRVLRLSAVERELRIERLRLQNADLFDGLDDDEPGPPAA
ncbi:hypothetical protein [Curtobacterium sp. 458]|uniref:hypothetical protein n=1 Tax=Curtobacterium sp. 458 TaxID=3050069 RepID=UPI0025B57A43|nr:hypothetical protein [Curtobacterium sp. 458]WJY01127.1 hypothetical protein QPJ90_05370 [Curtobacterium sp. 458]